MATQVAHRDSKLDTFSQHSQVIQLDQASLDTHTQVIPKPKEAAQDIPKLTHQPIQVSKPQEGTLLLPRVAFPKHLPVGMGKEVTTRQALQEVTVRVGTANQLLRVATTQVHLLQLTAKEPQDRQPLPMAQRQLADPRPGQGRISLCPRWNCEWSVAVCSTKMSCPSRILVLCCICLRAEDMKR